MQGSAAVSRVKVSADGHGVVSHTGVGMLREVADLTGCAGRLLSRWQTRTEGRGRMRPGMCSPICRNGLPAPG